MEVTKIDKENMRAVIMASAGQLKDGWDLAKNINTNDSFSNVVICGIGGSALPADLINALALPTIPMYIHRDYNLPKQANGKSLVICISYSGNTEEVISAFHQALDKKLTIIGMASGGKLAQMCQEQGLPLTTIPGGIQPRCATGYIFSALAAILSNSGIISDMSADILKTSQMLEDMNASSETSGKALAKKLVKKVPIIYSSENLSSVAKIWKIKFNENSKIPAFYNSFPELNHNEMVGYEGVKNAKAQNLHVITLRDSESHPRVLKRMELTAKLIETSGLSHDFVEVGGNSPIQKLFSTLLLGDWVSYYLALEYGIDPTPVKIVEEFKKELLK